MAASIDAEQPVLKVFGIPEITQLICGSNRKRDNISLMRVCRGLFYSALPLVWEEVDDVVPLISMIPGGGIFNYDADPLPPQVVMRCPRFLDLSRFNIYAPFIKKLVLPLVFPVDAHENWEEFLGCTRSVDLLPNLESINLSLPDDNLHPHYGEDIGRDAINWVIAFLSSSILALTMTSPEAILPSSWVDLALSHKLLVSVSKKCPNVGTLKVLPGDVVSRALSSHWRAHQVQTYSFSCDSNEISQALLSLGNLVYLEISPFILNPGILHAVAKLPALESLRIIGLQQDRLVYCRELQLPTQSFPALKHLELNRLTKETVVNIFKLDQFVSSLRSLSIIHPLGPGTGPGHSNRPRLTLFDIVTAIAFRNSKLNRLDIRLADELLTRPKSLQPWRRLPLISLHLSWDVFYHHEFETLHRLLSCLPLLKELAVGNFGAQGFELKQLRAIISLLPRLCRIRVPIIWESVLQLNQRDFEPLPSHPENAFELHLESIFYLPDPQSESAESVARFLSALRPASPVICQSARPFSYHYSTGTYIDQQPKNMISDALAQYYSSHHLVSNVKYFPLPIPVE